MSTTNRDWMTNETDQATHPPVGISQAALRDRIKQAKEVPATPVAKEQSSATAEAVDESTTSGRVADKMDHGKPRFSLVPQRTIWGLVAAFEYAAKKYRVEDPVANALRIENPRTRFYNGLHRHLSDWYAGRRFDDGPGGSGLPTLFLVLCNASLLLEVDAAEANTMPSTQDLNDPLK